jgi:ribosome-associated protein
MKKMIWRQVSEAITAARKTGGKVTILELEQGSGAFTDYFVVCSGSNPRQVQAISDEVEERLEKAGQRPTHVEGYKQAEWILLDYVNFVVHVFSEKARKFYDLEHLWKSAKRIEPSELVCSPERSASQKRRKKEHQKKQHKNIKKKKKKRSVSIRVNPWPGFG